MRTVENPWVYYHWTIPSCSANSAPYVVKFIILFIFYWANISLRNIQKKFFVVVEYD